MTAVALPNSARAKWAGLQDAEDEAQSFVLASVRRIGELQKALHFNPQGDKAANLEFEISRLRARQGVQQSNHQARAAINARVRHWLTGLGPSVVIEACEPLKVTQSGRDLGLSG